MKKRPNRTIQHAPHTLQHRELQTIKGGNDLDQPAAVVVNQEINRNLK